MDVKDLLRNYSATSVQEALSYDDPEFIAFCAGIVSGGNEPGHPGNPLQTTRATELLGSTISIPASPITDADNQRHGGTSASCCAAAAAAKNARRKRAPNAKSREQNRQAQRRYRHKMKAERAEIVEGYEEVQMVLARKVAELEQSQRSEQQLRSMVDRLLSQNQELRSQLAANEQTLQCQTTEITRLQHDNQRMAHDMAQRLRQHAVPIDLAPQGV